MDEQLQFLIQLQETDGKIRTRVEQKAKLPALIAALEARLTTSADVLAAAREALAEAQKSKRDRDGDLEAGQQKVEKLKSRTGEIKTNKEYQAMLKEIETAEQENKAIEEQILVLMERIDAAAAQIKDAEKAAAEAEAEVRGEREQIEASFAKVDEELRSLEQSRQDAASRISSPVLVRYEHLLRSKYGRAVVAARGETCAGCHMSIPPQVFVNVKKNDSIISCPHCNRILYFIQG
jgi:predicted  nucleic acid-binding Zn-ribbon protein